MTSTGANITARVELDLGKFESKIGTVTKELNKLNDFKFNSENLTHTVSQLEKINTLLETMGGYAKEVNQAFTNFKSMSKLVADLEKVLTSLTRVVTKATNLEHKLSRVQEQLSVIIEEGGRLQIGEDGIINGVTRTNAQLKKTQAILNKIPPNIQEIIDRNKANVEFVNEFNGLLKYSGELENIITNNLSRRIQRREEELAITEAINTYNKQAFELVAEEFAEEDRLLAVKKEEEAIQQAINDAHKKALDGVIEEFSAEEKKLAVLKEENALKEKSVALDKEDSAINRKTPTDRKNSLDTNILRRTGSMFATMFLFNEMMEVAEGTKEIAENMQTIDYWGKRLQKDQVNGSPIRTKKEIDGLKNSLGDLQKQYQKIDMIGVASHTMEAVDKYKIQQGSLKELTEIYAVATSQFAKEGRTQEDSILAVNDALDGEFRRLKEIGITQDSLKANGWNGDLQDKSSLIKALNKNMEQLGYKQTAQAITSWGEALDSLKIKLSSALAEFVKFSEPAIVEAFKVFIFFLEEIVNIGKDVYGVLDKLIPDSWNGYISKISGIGLAFGVMVYAVNKVIKSLGLFNSTGTKTTGVLDKLREKFGSKSNIPSSSTGGIVGGGKYSGDWKKTWKEGFLGQIEQMGKDMGRLARGFTVAVVGLSMAMATIWIGLEELALIGQRYKSIEGNVKKGVQAVKDTALIIVPIVASVMALNYAMSKLPQMGELANIGTTALLLASVMLETAMVIALLIPSIYAIESIGGMFNPSKVNKGVSIIKETAIIIVPIALAIGLLGVALGSVGVEGSLILAGGMLVATGIIVEAMLETAIVIESLKVPIDRIVSVGQSFDPSKVKKGAEIIKTTAEALKSLANAMGSVTDIQWANFKGQIIGESDIQELDRIANEVLPKIKEFASKFNTAMNGIQPLNPNSINALKGVASSLQNIKGAVTNVTTTMSALRQQNLQDPSSFNTVLNLTLFKDIQHIKTFVDKVNALGLTGGNIGSVASTILSVGTAISNIKRTVDQVKQTVGAINGAEAESGGLVTQIGVGLVGNGSLDNSFNMIYQSLVSIKNFLTKVSSLSISGEGASGISAISTTITQLNTAITQLSNSVKTNAVSLKANAVQLGRALPTGFQQGASGFRTTVNSVIQQGLNAINGKKGAFQTHGNGLATSLNDGYKVLSGKLQSTTQTEINYTLDILSRNKQAFYNKGAELGKAVADGYEGSSGLVTGSPARIARTTAQEMKYTLEAIDRTVGDIYKRGATLGSALANGYDSKVNMSMVKGANGKSGSGGLNIPSATNGGSTTNHNKSTANTVNIDLSNAIIFGVDDLERVMGDIAERKFFEMNSPNRATGY